MANASGRIRDFNEPSFPVCNIFKAGQQRPVESQTIDSSNPSSGSGLPALDIVIESCGGRSARQNGD
eukprot:6757455-Karenia_brevis.AAC.1